MEAVGPSPIPLESAPPALLEHDARARVYSEVSQYSNRIKQMVTTMSQKTFHVQAPFNHLITSNFEILRASFQASKTEPTNLSWLQFLFFMIMSFCLCPSLSLSLLLQLNPEYHTC
jgi:hypothetical protein